jgi:hypothetical protein
MRCPVTGGRQIFRNRLGIMARTVTPAMDPSTARTPPPALQHAGSTPNKETPPEQKQLAERWAALKAAVRKEGPQD